MLIIIKNIFRRNIFWVLLCLTYTILYFYANQLQGPFWADEHSYYQTSQQFSQKLIPSLNQIRNYNELNTPLPFIIYGQFQYLFQSGLFGGRLLNYFTSITIAILIGWPGRRHRIGPILALIGLFLYPYFLWFSTRYYTDIFAALFSLLGIAFYLQKWHIPSALAFVLAIASRQYMLAFPLAVSCHELVVAICEKKRPSLSFFLPAIAALSILGWILLFGDLAPSGSFQVRNVPPVQLNLWNLTPSSGLYGLACIGFFYVIPEWLLFNRSFDKQTILKPSRVILVSALLALFIIFPPHLLGKGLIWKLSELSLLNWLKPVLFYFLISITGLRFFQVNLEFWIVLYHTLIMMKAYPWDKYALPILVVLWFLIAHNERCKHFKHGSK